MKEVFSMKKAVRKKKDTSLKAMVKAGWLLQGSENQKSLAL